MSGVGLPVGLREVASADLPAFYEHQADPAACRMAAFTPRDRDAFFAHWNRILADPDVLVRTILAGGRVVGNVGSFERDGPREVGYWIERASWGRGIATRALRLFLEIEPVRPLHAHVAAHNAGSIRVLERCGFEVAERYRAPATERGPSVDELSMVLRR